MVFFRGSKIQLSHISCYLCFAIPEVFIASNFMIFVVVIKPATKSVDNCIYNICISGLTQSTMLLMDTSEEIAKSLSCDYTYQKVSHILCFKNVCTEVSSQEKRCVPDSILICKVFIILYDKLGNSTKYLFYSLRINVSIALGWLFSCSMLHMNFTDI